MKITVEKVNYIFQMRENYTRFSVHIVQLRVVGEWVVIWFHKLSETGSSLSFFIYIREAIDRKHVIVYKRSVESHVPCSDKT